MKDVINLISETITSDEYGNQIAKESENPVYADVASVTANEFFSAGETGHRPVFRFDVFVGDYSGERLVEYGKRYLIYRVYYNGRTVELYAEERAGV